MPAAITAAVSYVGSTLLSNTVVGAFLMMNAGFVTSAPFIVGGVSFSASDKS